MNIGGIRNPFSGLSSTYSVQGTQALQGDGDNDSTGDVRRPHGHGHRGGQMQKDLTSALDSIGLTVPGAGLAPPPPDGTTGSDRGSDSSVGADQTIQTDLKQFLQALGQAVQGQSGASSAASSSATSSSSGGSTSFDPKAGFASGLSALISQVAAGQAPQGLQDAFSRLAADLTTADAASSTSSTTAPSSSSSAAASSDATGTTAASSAANTQATLQALLTQLQQNIGYAGHRLQSVGNLLSTQV